ncbi:MAG TPA: ornithine cyclodeaminase family protein [Sphingomicrobium sp.]|nr:ornithine cyclodeaminase family protein [Sphingomicrobium sp.]
MCPPDALIITRRDIQRVMAPADYLAAVERAFRAAELGKAHSPHPMHLPMQGGGFHAKGASISLDRDYVAVKVNGNFPRNPTELGLPTIQGAILLFDGSNGVLLAIIDSIEVTLRRTAAASALAARLLARPDSRTLLICGCGEQGRAHVEAIRDSLPIERCLLWDQDVARAEQLAAEIRNVSGLDALAFEDLKSAAGSADLIACCTTSREPILDVGMVAPGTFIAAVGADHPYKSEIAPRLMAEATVVTDVLAQCAEMGDLHHAIEAGTMTEADVHAEIGQLLVGSKAGRSSPQEMIIFDSTGTGLQDVAAAAVIYELCRGDGSLLSTALAAR